MAKYFFDTEFAENGPHEPIWFLSIGMVTEDEDGSIREYYAVNKNFDKSKANEFVLSNVIPKLKPKKEDMKTTDEIASDIIAFVGDDLNPMFVADHCSYDWVVICQLFGTMMDLPDHFPKFCLDVQQLKESLGNPEFPQSTEEVLDEHNALADAHECKGRWEFLQKYKFVGKNFNLKDWKKHRK